jgi:hypothetical protein
MEPTTQTGATMSEVVATLTAQFNRLGPASLRVSGKSYARKGGVYDNSAGLVRFDYVGRKQRGAFVADKVTIAVRYDVGADLYSVEIVRFDGASFATDTIKVLDGVYAEDFARVGEWVN